jgi:hypothetical protein
MKAYTVEFATRCDVDSLVRKHYLHKWPGVVVERIGLLNEDMSAYIGVIVFALPPRETCKRYGVTVAWELARLYIEDVTPKNTETWFISRAIRLIAKNRPDVELLVSYADPSAGHSGTIYRAGNWIADGRTDDERKTPRFDYVSGSKHFSRRAHTLEGPAFAPLQKVPRVSKPRFVYWMRDHEIKRRMVG